ncbi:4Fe-4S dicluster domain-containing protein [Noviherbaspirillum aerium]|uniref:4Fe-4S dicluster domain-containing protein n=1 Tax=Noviherbaspirillum aerium TaxID=2588497 RepID=UPI00124E7687|nr:4Fe-4S dicluster domain-containing protein [Noviherbaspirillum aerium]
MTTKFHVCNCNRTMPLNAVSGQRIGEALGGAPLPIASQLCGRDAGAYLESVKGVDDVVVACTQESALFRELAEEGRSVAPLRFVNIRETGGWSAQSYAALPKMAALLADAARPMQQALPTVSYASQGRVLIIGSADDALYWAEQLQEALGVAVLITGSGAIGESGPRPALPAERTYPVFSGSDVRVEGWLGAFQVKWRQSNPIDLDLCVRCNECVAACPEGAIDLLYQIDEDKCRRHGDCVQACGAVEAISFTRNADVRNDDYDLIFDLSDAPLLAMHQPPQGYFAPGSDLRAQTSAAGRLAQMTGEYEKPKYFQYRERLCAHGRNKITGCNACIDICSAQAIRADGDRVRVEPHLCAGCGACATVCPSGALAYANADVPYNGKRIKTLLDTYARAGGEEACLLFYGQEHGGALITQLGRLAKAGKSARGLPARVMPFELHHVASAGIDLWLAAICYGASQIAVLVTGREAPDYVAALRRQVGIAEAILSGLGYRGPHVTLIEAETPQALDAALQGLGAGEVPAQAAGFHLFAEKRNSLDFIFDHLYAHAPSGTGNIALPAGAPFGTLSINKQACTLCMACTGSCPSSALLTTADRPQLRFIEKNCVQCGVCAKSCPEQAIELVPRLVPPETAKATVVLNEAEPFHCIRCSKPIGTLKAIENLLGRLAGHAAFEGNMDRIKMCGDCRVADMMTAKKPDTIVDLVRPR